MTGQREGHRVGFLSRSELERIGFKSLGENVSISDKCSIYSPETISIGSNVRIDDFCCLSGGGKGITIGSYVHIATYCVLYGKGGITLKDFSGLSSRVALFTVSDDFSGEFLTNPTVPKKYLRINEGKIILQKHVIIGTNSTILPNVEIGEGAAVGAHSLVERSLMPWGIYMGVPARKIRERSNRLLELEQELLRENQK